MIKTTHKYLDLLNDFSFKFIFGREANKDILIAFLNALFEGEKTIVDLKYNQTEHSGADRQEKKILFDLLCTGSDVDQFIIEMQRTEQKYFRDRAIYYMSRLISQQLGRGKNSWHKPLDEIYLIAILDFSLADSDAETYLQDVCLMNKHTYKVFYDRIGYKFLELPNFDKGESELITNLDKWVYLLKNMHLLDKLPEFLNEGIFQKVFNITEMSKLTKDARMRYERDLKTKSDYDGGIAYAIEKAEIHGHAKGQKEGLAEGRLQGHVKGLVEGLVEGEIKGSYQKALEIASKMKKTGFTVSQIQSFTNLSIVEIERL
jgi:predicted transposase/invertase (TIGR01784 family)